MKKGKLELKKNQTDKRARERKRERESERERESLTIKYPNY